MTLKPLFEWAGAGILVGMIVGGGGVYWWTYQPLKTVVQRVPGPERIVTRKVIVYRHDVVAAKRVLCGRHQVTVTATLRPARTPVASKQDFGAKRIHLSIKAYTSFLSYRQRISLMLGYGLISPIAGMPQAGLSAGVRDRFLRVGMVRGEAQVLTVGPQVLVLVDARIDL